MLFYNGNIVFVQALATLRPPASTDDAFQQMVDFLWLERAWQRGQFPMNGI